MKTPLKLKLIILFLSVLSCNNDDTPDPQETKSSGKQILSFSFLSTENANLMTDIVATIDETTKSINASVPNGTDVSALNPKITVSEKANFGPSGAQNFSTPIDFTVNAEDGSQVIYTASIAVMESNEAILESINPSEGPKGTIVTISGSNFGLDLNEVSVFFNEVEAEVQSVTNSEITTLVPSRAYTGEVKVLINGMELIGPSFNYTISEVTVTTFVGSKIQGTADGMGANAQFKNPGGLALGSDGIIYVADVANGLIRKVTPEGMVITIAGSTPGFLDGAIDVAQFDNPTDMVFDENGNMYVTDAGNHRIRKITPDGMVSTLAGSSQGYNDGPGETALFNLPDQIVLDSDNNLVVTDRVNDKIRKVTLDGIVSTFAGSSEGSADGNGTAAMFNAPIGILEDENHDLYIVDYGNHKIRRISENADVTTFAGSILGYLDGTSEEAQFFQPICMAKDKNGVFYVSDGRNRKIRKITPDGVVSTLAGTTQGYTDGPADIAEFEFPSGIVIDADGIIYVADQGNNCIRKIIQE
ncbi:IPT/TIG domain-containing protein [Maribacter sp. 2307UL18-2]|uniref:IPT/TIG domain-containing protein n=1 Tax=Maribacter sp. 2307UL18-2 TaxID=3386274 RepID=UPI0039BC2FBE